MEQDAVAPGGFRDASAKYTLARLHIGSATGNGLVRDKWVIALRNLKIALAQPSSWSLVGPGHRKHVQPSAKHAFLWLRDT